MTPRRNITRVLTMDRLESLTAKHGGDMERTGFGWELVLPGVTYRLYQAHTLDERAGAVV